jgi:serine/threonine-protein kinase
MASTTVPAREVRRSPARETIFENGRVLGGTYEILRVLGEGGMGQVYEANDLLLGRRVAIKAAWPNRDRSFLRREAQALAAVRHPSMVAIHHIATTEDGTDYVVMERIYGISLAHHIGRRRAHMDRFTTDEVLEILVGIADGLAIVHRSGLAHRDVKPANVMLAPGNRVVLMDFGLARPEVEATGDASHPSGTPDYMAPEAILEDARHGEQFLVDVYALGITAYELLTLRLPFPGRNTAEIWQAHLAADMAPDPRKLRADVPPQLAELVVSMIDKDPERRPESMEGIVRRLRTLRGATTHEDPRRPFSVLIVDDDPDFTPLVRHVLRRAVPHAAIATAHEPEAAIAQIHKHPPDLILLDLRMPTMNGIELAMYVRGTHLADATAIVAVSALAREDDLTLLRTLGITTFVPKGPELEARLPPVVREIERLRSAS